MLNINFSLNLISVKQKWIHSEDIVARFSWWSLNISKLRILWVLSSGVGAAHYDAVILSSFQHATQRKIFRVPVLLASAVLTNTNNGS